MCDVILSLDIGGTNCRMGLVSRNGQLLERRMVSTTDLARANFMTALASLLREVCNAWGARYTIRAVSIGFPATIDRARRHVLQAPNIANMEDNLPICDVLEEALGIPVFLDRDVNLLLAYDLQQLELKGDETVIGIYFGTGIGNSIYMGGKFISGRNGVAGEIGHIPQLGATAVCGCGNTGCLEPLGGGRRLSELCATEFPQTDITEIYLRHSDSAQVRQQVDAMAVAVATEVNILDPDYVVLGGGLLQMQGFPIAYLEEQIRAHTRRPFPLENLRLVYARPNQENGILGAGILGWMRLA